MRLQSEIGHEIRLEIGLRLDLEKLRFDLIFEESFHQFIFKDPLCNLTVPEVVSLSES